MTEQKRGYPAIFWEYVGYAYNLNAVSETALARELGLDRKHLRDTRIKLGWERMGERPIGEPEKVTQDCHDALIEEALSFKSGEFADLQEIVAAADEAGSPSPIDFMAARAEARRHA